MAERHTSDDAENGNGFDRRTYLKLAGATAAAAATGFASAAGATPNGYDPDTVVDLGEQGLTNGDVIDPYLEEYHQNNVEVRVPEGEYRWNGGGFHRQASRNAGVIGEGEVILNMDSSRFNNNIRAEGGALVYKNFTVRGKVTDSRIRLETDSSGYVLVDNWNFPDGAEDDDRSRAFYAPREHAGTLEIRNCYISEFSDNGIYASSPGYDNGGYDGKVIVDGCVTHNINIAGIRVGSTDSVVRNCVVINDGRSPDTGSAHNQRGIWVRGPGDNITIENCDIIHSWSGATAPINFSRAGDYSSGHIEGVRIYNETSTNAVNGAPSDWSGNDIHVTGGGDLDVPSWFTNVCTGSNCEEPTSETDAGTSDQQQDTEEDVNWADVDEIELVLETTNSDGIEYEFTTTGQIEPLHDRSGYNANSDTDGAEQNDDGTWTGYGATSGGSSQSGDAFRYTGDMLAWSVTGDVQSLTVYANGRVVDPEQDLIVESDGSSDGSTDGGSSDGSTDDGSTDGGSSDGSTDDGSTDGGSTDGGSSDGSTDEETLDNRIIIDGTNSRRVSSYTISVTGQIEADPSLSSTVDGGTPWDELDGQVDQGTVTDVVGMGIDGYRYSGHITGLSVDGGVEITVENNDL